ncbi:hypothetical protein C8F01DRAFT_1252835 [Mycena amicta]|nr:hypothetical protein C8F01DRAFT_1252835 [Mycena amicta]
MPSSVSRLVVTFVTRFLVVNDDETANGVITEPDAPATETSLSLFLYLHSAVSDRPFSTRHGQPLFSPSTKPERIAFDLRSYSGESSASLSDSELWLLLDIVRDEAPDSRYAGLFAYTSFDEYIFPHHACRRSPLETRPYRSTTGSLPEHRPLVEDDIPWRHLLLGDSRGRGLVATKNPMDLWRETGFFDRRQYWWSKQLLLKSIIFFCDMPSWPERFLPGI